jgi:hypothetical protein
MAHDYRILIGANGWLHPAWQGGFYPEDLPQDWQLGYYSNEFPIVLLSAEAWSTVRDEIGDWLEDCNDELRIVCEIPGSMLRLPAMEAKRQIEVYLSELTVLAEHLVAVILPITKFTTELETLLGNINCPVPVCIELDQAMPEAETKLIQKMCEQKQWPLLWHGEQDPSTLSYGRVAICRIRGMGMVMRQLREVVETMLKLTTPEQTAILIIDGEPPDLTTIRNANVILDLF